jgi:hypothetical protein
VEHHALDKRSDDLQSLGSIGPLQSNPQALNLLAIHVSQLGVQPWCRRWCCAQVPFQFRFARFEFVQALLQARSPEAVGDGLDDSSELALNHVQFPAPVSIVR